MGLVFWSFSFGGFQTVACWLADLSKNQEGLIDGLEIKECLQKIFLVWLVQSLQKPRRFI